MNKVNRGMDTLNRVKAEWELVSDGDISFAGNSLLQPVLSEGRPAMLKVPLNKEEQRGFRLLACWEGRAAVNVPVRCACASDGARS
jgi:streptomycin 6-kinase